MFQFLSRLPAVGRRRDHAVRLAQGCGAAVVTIGCLTLLGWALNVPALKSVLPGLVAMQPITAICLASGGVSLIAATLSPPWARWISAALAVFVLLAGLQTLLENALQVDFGTDRLFFREAVLTQQPTPHLRPGRMAGSTALVQVLIAATLLLARGKSAIFRQAFVASATAGLLFVALTLISHVFDVTALQGIGFYATMALHTALGCTVLLLGALALRPDAGWLVLLQGRGPEAIYARVLFALVIVLPVLVGWLTVQGSRLGLYEPDFRLAVSSLGTIALLASVVLAGAARIRRAEAELRRSEAHFRLLAENAPQIICGLRAEGGLLGDWANAEWYRYTGAADFSSATWIEHLHPADRERIAAQWAACLQSAKPFAAEHQCRRADGSYGWLLSRALPVRDAAGHIVRWVGISTDITEIRAAAEDRERLIAAERAARAEAESANRLKDEFLGTLSHELRTPLANIVSWARVLQRRHREGDEQLRQGLDIIIENAMTQNLLISDLLDTSRIVRGKVTLDARPLGLGGFLEQCVAAHRPGAESKGVTLDLGIELAGAAIVLADAARLQQVMGNLLANAIKFTPAGGRVRVAVRDAEGGYEIAVRDTGEGIAPEVLPYVFERFRQGDSSSARRHGGLGLGLAIVKQLVELHGGRVRAESLGTGLGATFTVFLPAAGAPLAADARNGTDGTRGYAYSGPLEPESLKGLRVLVVEDEPAMLEYVKDLLEEHGARVHSCTSAAEALEILRRPAQDAVTIHVLVSDLGMPGMDGFALVRAVRRELGLGPERLPALAVTAYTREEDLQRAHAAGYQHCLTKPFEGGSLVNAVRQLKPAASAERVGCPA